MVRNNYQIRTMQAADLSAVFLIEQEQLFPWTQPMLENCLQANNECLVLLSKQEIIGFAILMLAADQADILNIAIKANWRQQGYGYLLLEKLIDIARGAPIKKIYLEVRVSNIAAQQLYKKAGFKIIGQRNNYYTDQDRREDALVMVYTY